MSGALRRLQLRAIAAANAVFHVHYCHLRLIPRGTRNLKSMKIAIKLSIWPDLVPAKIFAIARGGHGQSQEFWTGCRFPVLFFLAQDSCSDFDDRRDPDAQCAGPQDPSGMLVIADIVWPRRAALISTISETFFVMDV